MLLAALEDMKKGCLRQRNSPSKGWAVKFSKPDGGRRLGYHGFGEREGEQGHFAPRATLSLRGRNRE